MSEASLTRRGLLGLAAVSVSGGYAAPGRARAAAGPSEPIVSWINRTAAGLPRVDAGGSVDDLRTLRDIVGGARVVALGEPSHGTHEQLTLRHRAARFLVERMGFRTVAWEESWPSGVAVDRYVTSGKGDPRAIVGDMGFQWRSDAMLDLVRWMRAFNRHRSHRDKVRFLGSDVMEVRALPYEEIVQYVTEVAPQRLAELQRDLHPIRWRGSVQAHFEWLFSHTFPQLRQLAERARRVKRLVASLPPGRSHIERDYAVQHANAILGFHETYAEQLAEVASPVRDRHIARILTWWQHRTRHPAVYCAANVHTTANPRVTWKFPPDPTPLQDKTMAGGHLRRQYGRSYVSIATISDHGQLLAGWEVGAPQVFTIPPPGPATVDHVLGQARHTDYLLDLHAPAPALVRRWREGPATMRLIGSAYDADRDADYAMTVESWRRGFDAVLHLGATTPTRLLQ